MPCVSRNDSSTSRRSFPTGRTLFARVAQVGDHGPRVGHRRRADLGRLAERVHGRDRGLGERALTLDEVVDGLGVGAKVAQQRRRLVGQRTEPHHRRLELVEELRQRLDVGGQVPAPLRGGLGDIARVADRAGHALAVARQRLEHSVGVDRELLEHGVLVGQDLEHLVGLAQRRVRPPDDLVEVAAAPGHRGAELIEDQRQPLALGRAHGVADQVDVDRLGRVLDRQQALALARPVFDHVELRRRIGVSGADLGRLALDEALADQVLRADDAARVAAEVLVAGLGDLEHDRGLEVLGDVERLDLADLDAGDLHVLAGDDEARVVEDRPDAVGLLVLAGQEQHGAERDHDEDHRGDAEERPHRPPPPRDSLTARLTGPPPPGSGRSRGCRRNP